MTRKTKKAVLFLFLIVFVPAVFNFCCFAGLSRAGIVVEGDYVYTTSLDGFTIANINDPKAAVVDFLGSEYHFGFSSDICLSGKYTYLTCAEGLSIVDISDSKNPISKATCPISQIHSLKISGSYLYVAAGNNGLLILDVKEPEKPKLVTLLADKT